jgi:hypothetical protein
MKKYLLSILLFPIVCFAQTGKPIDTFKCTFDYQNLVVKDNSGRIMSRDTTKHMVTGWMIVFSDSILYYSPGFKQIRNAKVKNPHREQSIKLLRD